MIDIFKFESTPGPSGRLTETQTCSNPPELTWVPYDTQVLRVKGVNTPNFYRRQRSGDLLEATPWFKFDGADGIDSYVYGVDYRDGSSYTAASPPAKGYDLSNPEAVAAAVLATVDIDWADLANEAIDGLNPSFDLGTFIAELRETVQMIVGMAERFRRLDKIAERIRKFFDPYGVTRKSEIAKRFPKQIVNLWLEWRYGWRILIMDLRNLHKTISEKSSVFQVGTGSTVVEKTDDLSYPDTEYLPHQWERKSGEATLTVEARVTARAKFSVFPPKLEIDGIKTGYEVIPYSFVLDWFWDIGTYLSALLYQSKLDVMAEVVYSRSVKVSYSRYYSNKGWSTGWRYDNPNFACDWRAMSSERASWQRFDFIQRWPTSENAKLPAFHVDLDISHVADLIALLFQILYKVIRNGSR